MWINPEYSLEGLMLKLKRQYFGHLMWRTDSMEKDPDAGKDWKQEEKGTTEDEMVTVATKLKRCLLFGKKRYGQFRQHIKKQRHYFAYKRSYSQSYGFFQ